jgi:FkbM family methyltransferase
LKLIPTSFVVDLVSTDDGTRKLPTVFKLSSKHLPRSISQLTVKSADKARLTLQFLLQSPLPASLSSKVLRTELLLVAQRLLHLRRELGLTKNKEPVFTVHSRVLDFEVAAYTPSNLMFLHGQIFRDLEYFFRSERSDPFILDGGSNIGMSILFFKALYPEAKIIGFEPNEPSYELLKRNIASNGLTGVEVHQAALGAQDSTIDFFVDPDEPGSVYNSTIRERQPKKKTVVRQARLSTFVDRNVDLLKLDIEGAEGAVLEDLVSSGAISRIDQMIIEYDHHIDQNRDALGAFLSVLEENGFGYQISASYSPNVRISRGGTHQNVLVYAYQKNPL